MIKKYYYRVEEYEETMVNLEKTLARMREQGWVPISVSKTNDNSFLVTYETWTRA